MVSAGAALRLFEGLARPGWEFDEPVYGHVAANLSQGRGLTIKQEYFSPSAPYLAQPPFYFWLLRVWFAVTHLSGIEGARALAVVMSGVVVVATSWLVFRCAGRGAALVTAALLAMDSWLVFENRIGWMDNTHLAIIAVMWLAWVRAVRRAAAGGGSLGDWLVVGLLLGLVICFKHIGLLYGLSLGIALLLQRRAIRQRFRLLTASAAVAAGSAVVVGTYCWVMYQIYGGIWLDANVNQFRRASGQVESRGTITAPSVVTALTHQYALFTATWVAVALAALLMLGRAIQVVRRRTTWQGLEPLVASTMGAGIGLALLGMRFPHYFMLAFVPLLAYLGAEIALRWASMRGQVARRALIVVALPVLLLGDAVGAVARITSSPDDALEGAIGYLRTRAEPGSVVIADEPIGVSIAQRYCRIDFPDPCLSTATWVVTYESLTQELPANLSLYGLLARASSCATFQGFKEDITVYRVAGDC